MFIELLLIELGSVLVLGGIGILIAKILAKAINEQGSKKIEITTPGFQVIDEESKTKSRFSVEKLDSRELTRVTLAENKPISTSIETDAQILDETSK